MTRVKSIILVTIQLSTMGGILLTGPWIAHDPVLLALEIAGCAIGAWSVAAMRPGNLRVMPELGADHQLVTAGPYRVVRHPMYTAVLIAFFALVADKFTTLRAAIALALFIVLVMKMRREEENLRARFADYAGYARRTKRLVPFIW